MYRLVILPLDSPSRRHQDKEVHMKSLRGMGDEILRTRLSLGHTHAWDMIGWL